MIHKKTDIINGNILVNDISENQKVPVVHYYNWEQLKE